MARRDGLVGLAGLALALGVCSVPTVAEAAAADAGSTPEARLVAGRPVAGSDFVDDPDGSPRLPAPLWPQPSSTVVDLSAASPGAAAPSSARPVSLSTSNAGAKAAGGVASQALLERARREAVGGVYDRDTADLIDGLRQLPAVAAVLTQPTAPRTGPVLDVRFEINRTAFGFFSMLTTVGTPIDVTVQELRVEEFFPADEATIEAWRRLVGSDDESHSRPAARG